MLLLLSLSLFPPLSFAYLLAISLPGNTFLFLSFSFFLSTAFHHSSPLFFHPHPLFCSILSFSRLGNSRADGFYIFKLLARKVALTFKSKGSTASMEESGPLSLSLAIRYTATVKDSFCNSLNPRPRGAIFYYFARCPVMRQFLSDRSFVHAYLTLLTLCLFFLFFLFRTTSSSSSLRF